MVYQCINVVTLSTNQNRWSAVNEPEHRSHIRCVQMEDVQQFLICVNYGYEHPEDFEVI